jgi:hypothetical protein
MVDVRRLCALLVVAAAVAGVAGCAAAPAAPTFSFSVFQLRSDYAPRQAQIEITNRSGVDVEITSATFESAWFAGAVTSRSTPSQVVGRGTTDFPVVLAAPKCLPANAKPVVTIRYTATNGASGSVRAIPTVPFGSLTAVHRQDCSRVAFEEVAQVSIAKTLRFETVDGKPIALLDVTITPTDERGSVTLHSIQDTTLLAQREGQLRSVELTFDSASPPTTITLDFVPARCEQHVVAEDKVGTVIPFHVDAGQYRDAEFGIPVSPAVKTQFLDWVGRYCGW